MLYFCGTLYYNRNITYAFVTECPCRIYRYRFARHYQWYSRRARSRRRGADLAHRHHNGSFTFPEKNAFDGEQAVWVLICIGGDGRFLTNIDFGVFAVRTVFIVSISTSVVALPNSITQRYSSAYSHSMVKISQLISHGKPGCECTAAQSNGYLI